MELSTVFGQVYVTPFIMVTHDKILNGNREFIIGWLKWILIIKINGKTSFK